MSEEILQIVTARELAKRVCAMQGSRGILLFATNYRVDKDGQIGLSRSMDWWRVLFYRDSEMELLEVGSYDRGDRGTYNVTGGLSVKEYEEIFEQLFKKLSVEKVCVASNEKPKKLNTEIKLTYKVEAAAELASRIHDIQDTEEVVTFATWFELDEDGQVNASDIGEWWGAKFYEALDGKFLQIGAYGGGDWYTYDATNGLCIEEIENHVGGLFERFAAKEACVEVKEECEMTRGADRLTYKIETAAGLAKRVFDIQGTDAVVTLVTRYRRGEDGQIDVDSDTKRWGIMFYEVFDGKYLLAGEYGGYRGDKFCYEADNKFSTEDLEEIAKSLFERFSIKEVCVEISEGRKEDEGGLAE